MRDWCLLQELSGVHSEPVRRAVEGREREIEKRHAQERAALEAAHLAEIERVRGQAVQQAVERLVPLLMDLATAPSLEAVLGDLGSAASALAAPPPAAREGVGVPAAPAVAPGPALAPPAASIEQPYIDSALCTTCNECTNLNGKMFKYNADKQAYLADASAGSYEQLVRAAAKCPARCIHPGKPRPEDRSATAAVVARAAAYN
jgi:ferredoxin